MARKIGKNAHVRSKIRMSQSRGKSEMSPDAFEKLNDKLFKKWNYKYCTSKYNSKTGDISVKSD